MTKGGKERLPSGGGGGGGDGFRRESEIGGRFGATPEMNPPPPERPGEGKTAAEASGEAAEEEDSVSAVAAAAAAAAFEGGEMWSATEVHCRPKYIVFLYMPFRSTWTEGKARRITCERREETRRDKRYLLMG